MDPGYLQRVSVPVSTDPGAWGAHDPTVVRSSDGQWLMFSTDTRISGGDGVGVQIRQSDDLVHWRWFGHAFDGVPEEAEQWSGARGIWAPEVIHRDGHYRMYYSASSFGSRTSAIALATAPDATGPWQHSQIVVATQHQLHDVNAIDAAVVTDQGGQDWMLYGSFFGGLRILPLDEDGLPNQPGDLGQPVLKRAVSIDGAVEGGHILPTSGGDYALICSFDSLFDTYNIRVSRSDDVAGPYRDARGAPMLDDSEPPAQVGTVILMSYQAPDGQVWVAPGHSSHVTTPHGVFLVHHVRDGDNPRQHIAHLRPVRFTEGGWPLASPLPWQGPADTPPKLAGSWVLYCLDPEAPTPLLPRSQAIHAEALTELAAKTRGQLQIDGVVLDAVLFQDAGGVAFAGLDQQGVVVWGIRSAQ